MGLRIRCDNCSKTARRFYRYTGTLTHAYLDYAAVCNQHKASTFVADWEVISRAEYLVGKVMNA